MFYKLPILKVYAGRVLKEKITSLGNDVNKCLSTSENKKLQPAVFTALLACFSTLDFLSALHSGNAGASSSTTKQVKDFLAEYFDYGPKKRELLLEIYRHKLVHLFQPGHLVEYKNKSYSWRIYTRNRKKHLVITKKNGPISPAPSVRLMVHYIFSVSITSFTQDVTLAAEKYYKELMRNKTLQINFDRAMNHIFSIYPKS